MNGSDLFPGFASRHIAAHGAMLNARIGGDGPPLAAAARLSAIASDVAQGGARAGAALHGRRSRTCAAMAAPRRRRRRAASAIPSA